MQLGFVSAILPDLTLEEVLHFAAEQKFDCVEVMCWPKGAAASPLPAPCASVPSACSAAARRRQPAGTGAWERGTPSKRR